MRRERILATVIIGLVFCFSVSAVPLLPCEYYGMVTINGDPAPVGTVMSAYINGEQRGSTITTLTGYYGSVDPFGERLVVTGNEEDPSNIISFRVGGVEANEKSTFVQGKIQQFDLSVDIVKANFTADMLIGKVPLTVRFRDTSSGMPIFWFWEFGDGNESLEQHPIYTYTNPGTYRVDLTVGNGKNIDTLSMADYITVQPKVLPVVNFTANVTSGRVPLVVGFTDTSRNDSLAWLWDFGDGDTSTLQNPVHTYAVPGNYSVSLSVTNEDGTANTIRADYISVLPRTPPVANFTANVTSGPVPLAVRFTDTSRNDPLAWLWDFGDGQTSNEAYPTHEYTGEGLYTVSLLVTNIFGNDTIVKTDLIHVYCIPVANFTANVTAGSRPLAVQFNDLSTGNPTNWLWTFGDGSTSIEQYPVHTYANSGNYTVSLNVSNAYGSNLSTAIDAVCVLAPPVAGFSFSPTEGNAPLTVNITDTSTGTVTAWRWDFGDGNISTEQNPVHTYTDAGTYSISLNASNMYAFNIFTVNNAVRVLEPPTAGFSFAPTEGNAPLTIHFSDTSLGNITARAWDFGDGNTSTEQNPEHLYADAGIYTVSLNASNIYGYNIATTTDAVTVLPEPVAGFTFTPDEGNAPLTVTFNGTSSGDITAWSWEFGDGAISTDRNTTHTYASAGTYTVSLNASNAYGFNISLIVDAISVLPGPVAGFTFSPDEGNAPLIVNFRDASTGNVTAWAWDFGDGDTSTEQNPSHTYATAGIYTVSLNASNIYGFNGLIVTDAVRVLHAPAAGFTFTPDEGNAPLIVAFTDESTGNVTAWSWDFGDGQTSVEQSPEHTYTTAGSYAVLLNASNAYGYNISMMTDAVQVLPAPVARFTFSPDEGNAPLAVTFTDASTGNVTAWTWDFGDGNTSTESSPLHTYANAGTYTVTLNASNAYGFNISMATDAVNVLSAPVAGFVYTPNEGNTPLTVQFTDASSGSVTSWFWDFGDETSSTEINPVHIYAEAGNYTVSLNVSNAYGFNISTATDAVRVLPAPAAGFTFTPQEGNAPLVVTFTDASSGDATAWAWDFGDGETSSEQNPAHTYANPGTYSISLNASNAHGFNISLIAGAVHVLPAPAADFSCIPNEGNAPLTVTFTDASTGNVTAWSWEFGDGNTSAEPSPTHTYVEPGAYTVSLNASNTHGYNVSMAKDAVLVLSAPFAGFTCTPEEGNAPLTVTFTDASDGNVTALVWDFGDGTTSTDQNPSHTYASAGTYTVSLNASNDYGFNISLIADAISVLPAPVAGFIYTPNEGNAPLTVQFTDASIGNITTWSWGFGDGNTSTEQNPTHIYADAGTYTVSLNASNAYGFNISTVTDAINALAAPFAGFTFMPREGNAPLTVSFTDASTGNITGWAWQFGDGNGSTARNPVHTYSTVGTYTIILNVSNAYGANVSTFTNAIRVLEPSMRANFTANVTLGPMPFAVRFTDLSAGDPAHWHWTFGDGNTSTEQHPVHTYRAQGTYTVNLTVSNNDGSDTLSRLDYITVTNMKGDFNGDGIVDIGDVARVAYMVVGKTPADPAADFNVNGAVDIGDASKIAYFFVGKIEAL